MNMTDTTMTATMTPATLSASNVPMHVTDLRSSGIIVTSIMKTTTLSVVDRAASAEIARLKSADQKSLALNKFLLKDMPELTALHNMRQTMYNGLNLRTFDWAGDARYLPSPRFETFFAWWEGVLKPLFEERKAEFLRAYPAAVREEFDRATFKSAAGNTLRNGLGDLFNPNDYPTVAELDRKFSLTLVRSEVPVGDYRNVLFHEALGDAKAQFDQHVERQVQQMLDDQTKQLSTVLHSLSHCCEVWQESTVSGEVKVRRRKLYETTLGKALELCNLFAQFNPAGSRDLSEARDMLAAALDGVEYDALRESDTLRTQVKEEVDAIIGKFSF